MGVAWLALILCTSQPHVSSCLCVLFPQAAFRQGARTEWNLLSGAADRGRRQQPHYELLLHPNLASSQQQGERVQKPERQEDITKTLEWVRYPQWLL